MFVLRRNSCPWVRPFASGGVRLNGGVLLFGEAISCYLHESEPLVSEAHHINLRLLSFVKFPQNQYRRRGFTWSLNFFLVPRPSPPRALLCFRKDPALAPHDSRFDARYSGLETRGLRLGTFSTASNCDI